MVIWKLHRELLGCLPALLGKAPLDPHGYCTAPLLRLQIFGIRYGLRGFLDRHAKPVQLTHQWVDGIQLKGGTVLVRETVLRSLISQSVVNQ